MNSNVFNTLYRSLFSLRGMGQGVMNIGPKQLAWMPVPKEHMGPDESPDSLSGLGKALDHCDGMDPELVEQAEIRVLQAYEIPSTS